MCGRYAFAVKNFGRWGSILIGWTEGFDDRYNIPPTTAIPVFTVDGWMMMRWGLIPEWSKEPSTKYATFNARSESLIEKPAYRSAWKNGQRCLIPASGYFEWKLEGKVKKPYYIKSALDEPLVFAGLWDHWKDEEKGLYSCSIITRQAGGSLKDLHNRMPLMLPPEVGRNWLQGKEDDAFSILNANHDIGVQFYPVDPQIGNTRSQGPELIKPLHADDI